MQMGASPLSCLCCKEELDLDLDLEFEVPVPAPALIAPAPAQLEVSAPAAPPGVKRPSSAAVRKLLSKVGGTLEQAQLLHARKLDFSNKRLDADDASVVAYVLAVSTQLLVSCCTAVL